MRHGDHFVERLTVRDGTPIGRMLPLSSIQPDPMQPRSTVGDLSELVASIREKGVLEPILVRPAKVRRDSEMGPARLPPAGSEEAHEGESFLSADESGESFAIISGERRYRASLEAGLYEIPAIEMDVDDQEALEIALVENLQRQDLNPFEEADGYRALAELHQYTHDEIAKAVGKSRTVVTESLALVKAPQEVREAARALGLDSKSILLEVLKVRDPSKMLRLLEQVSSLGLGREAVRREVKRILASTTAHGIAGASRRPPYTFQFRSPDKRFRLSLSFRQSTVEPQDLISALEAALTQLRREHAEHDRALR